MDKNLVKGDTGRLIEPVELFSNVDLQKGACLFPEGLNSALILIISVNIKECVLLKHTL